MASETESSVTAPRGLDPSAVAAFQAHLAQSKRIVAVIGAGLSASSGLATFRDSNGLWANHDVHLIATPAGWRRDPGLVWQFYSDRRRNALKAEPNPAHYALAELAKKKPGFVALSQNVDGLLQRAGLEDGYGNANANANNPQLKLLHGNLFDLVCANNCGYTEQNFKDPLCPVLSEENVENRANVMGAGIKDGEKPPKASALLFEAIAAKNKKILGENFKTSALSAADAAPLKERGEDAPKIPDTVPVLHSGIQPSDLMQCPGCNNSLLRPRVVWFGEALAQDLVEQVDAWFEEDKVDLCLVIGTSGSVWPAAGYAEQARKKGARVAYVNMRQEDMKRSQEGDWAFVGDAAIILPEILGS
ncbi:DHS-like NAD/FAD-binding domain-containing protein [Periconia macrospinosa]|uniref:DHS-like NAD/FAD-binding domain-containing protein n=1 Tax=Periconia macrospinosa TaxID=97972 RepID=A0A2V1E1C6_9PLEO|nr:DHS-like NAD/FAD-binding domain-containing protein [Periconia macrospinosa]